MAKKRINKRKHLRYKPDLGTLALIDVTTKPGERFKPIINGLTLEESYGGASILASSEATKPLKKGLVIRIKVGNLHIMSAEIRWVKVIEKNIYKIGIQYLE